MSQQNRNQCSQCSREIQGPQWEKLRVLGLCENCWASTPEGGRYFSELYQDAKDRFGDNWRSVIAGHGDQ